ncbi:MAG: ABC transporter permease, partial [Ruminococcus sp.]|nr:ABC transporter permease [Ruminococcus sp.]
MYLRILKNDLKRKKTMNIILLLFVILSSMFASSSMNNIVSVMNGTQYFLDKAEIGDYFILTNQQGGKEKLSEILDSTEEVGGYRTEDVLYLASDSYQRDGEKLVDFTNASILQSVDSLKINIFNENNEKLTSVPEGKCYITSNIPERAELEIGDKFDIVIDDNKLTFEYAGMAKDALLGSDFMTNPRFLISESDYQKFSADAGKYSGNIFYIDTDDTEAVEAATSNSVKTLFSGDRAMIETSYVMNMIVAGIILVVSVGLILVSMVVLKFTIGFTIQEEFREIGVMKAIGLKNRSVRGLYLVKYVGIAIVGAVIGLFAGIPFGDMLLDSVSKSMVLGNDNGLPVSAVSSIAVVLIITGFSWRSTRKIKKMSPVDAVRSGQTGERFKKRGIMSLSKSKLGTTPFMAVNDILSAKKQFSIITAVFTVCILMVTILANTANTLSSDKLMFLLGTTKSDLYLDKAESQMKVIAGQMTAEEAESEIEQVLKENGYDAEVHFERWFSLPVRFGDKKASVPFLQSKKTKTTDYYYSEGKAPMYPNEVAVSTLSLEKIGAKIGDTIEVTVGGVPQEFIVSGSFQSFNNLGESARFHQDLEVPDSEISSAFSFQIDFADDPDKDEIEKRKEDLKEIFGTDNVNNSEEFVKDCT